MMNYFTLITHFMVHRQEVRFFNLTVGAVRLFGWLIFLLSLPAFVQAADPTPDPELKIKEPVTVTGLVTSSEDGQPLLGATVAVSGTDRGAFTDDEGRYSIEVESDGALAFSYLDHETQVVQVEGRTEINVVMAPKAKVLDAVIIIGYGANPIRPAPLPK